MNGEIAEKIGQSRSKRPPISFPFLVEKGRNKGTYFENDYVL